MRSKALPYIVATILICALYVSGCSGGKAAMSVSLTPSAAQSIDQGQTVAIAAAVANDPKNAGVTWAVSGGGSLSGSSTTATTYKAPASVQSNITATVTASSVADSTKSATLSITVAPAPAIATASLASGNQGTAYSANVSSTGGTGPYAWSIASGSLPAGLSLGASTSNSVTISGTPTAQGKSSFTIQVKDKAGLAASQPLTITINQPLPLAIVTTSLSAAAIGTAYSQTLQAKGGVQPFTWSISAGSLPAGLSLNNSTGAISGTPSGPAGAVNFTVKASDTEATPQTATANLGIVVAAAPALSVKTTSLPSGSVNAPYSTTLQAIGGLAPYTWTITSGTLPAGLTLDASTGVISGTPTTVTASTPITVQVADSETPVKTATASLAITINAAGSNNAALSGHYAFLFNGFDPNGYFADAGSFVADGNGNITNGLVDTNGLTVVTTNGTFTGTYSISSDNLGTMQLNFGGSVSTFAVAVSSDGSARFIEFDDSTGTGTRGSGVIKKQDTTAFLAGKIKGNYAFGWVGIDGPSAHRTAVAGEFLSDGVSSFSNGLADADANGTVVPNVTLSGTYTLASTGRGTAALTFTGQGTLNFSFYVVSAKELMVMEVDPVQGAPGSSLFSGEVLQQTGAGSFSNASLNGNSILELQGLGSTGSDTVVGVASWSNSGTLNLSADENQNGVTSSLAQTGTYAVSSDGRVTTTGLNQAPSSPPVFYLVNQNEGFVVGGDSSVTAGFFTPQSAGPFSNASFSGTYQGGSITPFLPNGNDGATSLTADGKGSVTVTSDNSGRGGLNQGTQSFTYSTAANGRIAVTQNGQAAGILYIVSPTQVILLGEGNNAVSIFTH